MRFKVDGRELSAERMRIGELAEAEKHLGLDMESGFAAKLAVCLYVAMRREEPTKPAHVLADEVMRVDLTELDFEEQGEAEAGPPAETVAAEGNGAGDHESLKTTGPLPSATT